MQGRSGVTGGGGFLTGGGGIVAATSEEAIRCWSSCFLSLGGPLGNFGLTKGKRRRCGRCWQRGGGGDDGWQRGGGLLRSSALEEGGQRSPLHYGVPLQSERQRKRSPMVMNLVERSTVALCTHGGE
jgi:hypothetical protein